MWIVTREAVVGIVRTGVSYLYALLLSSVPFVNNLLTETGTADEVGTFIEGSFVVIAGTIIYSVIRWVAEKFPAVGFLLVFNTKPTYTEKG